ASGAGNIATLVTLAVGRAVRFIATGTIPSGLVGSLTNTASAALPPSATDPTLSNNTATSTVTVTPTADVQVGLNGPVQATAGTSITYSITVTNAGPSDAVNVTLTDPTPTGLTFVSASGACSAGFPCSLGTIVASAAPVTISATFAVPPGYTTPDPIVNTAT